MTKKLIAIVLVSILVSSMAWAGHVEPVKKDDDTIAKKKPKDLDLVTDVVADVFSKANALLTGNLEITMDGESERLKTKDDYTTNALGQKVPKATAKSPNSLHIQ